MILVFLLACILLPSLSSATSIVIKSDENPIQQVVSSDTSVLCQIVDLDENETRPGLLWSKHGGIDRTGNVEVKRLDSRTLALIIRNGTVWDSGVYTCTAATTEGTFTQNIDIVFFEVVRFLDPKTSYEGLSRGSRVNISCAVNTNTQGFVTTWSKDNKLLAPSRKHNFYERGSVLEIVDYNPAVDAGDYDCRVLNPNTGSGLSRLISVGGEEDLRRSQCTQQCVEQCSKSAIEDIDRVLEGFPDVYKGN